MHLILALFLLPFGAIHFLPTIVALLRNSRHTLAIFFVNLLLGWTIVGWVVAMVWAATSEPKWRYGYARQSGYQPVGYRRW
jgi:hypothetical protein